MPSFFKNTGTSALSSNGFGGTYRPPVNPSGGIGGTYQPPAQGGFGGGYNPQPNLTSPVFRTDRPTGWGPLSAGKEMIYSSPEQERNLGLINQAHQRLKEQQAVSQAGFAQGVVQTGADVFAGSWAHQYNSYLAEIAREEAAIRAQYSPTISGLADDISDLGISKGKMPGIFDDYYEARDEIGAGVGPAENMGEDRLREVVDKVYDDAEAEVADTLKRIDVNMGPAVAESMYESVREFQNVMDDVLRTDIEAVDMLHEKSSEYAQALAQAAYSNDIYGAVASETRINAELDFSIREKQEDLARAKAAQAAAIRAAQERAFDYEAPSYETAFQQAVFSHFKGANMSDADAIQMYEQYSQLLTDPRATADAQTWRHAVWGSYNTDALAKAGISVEELAGMADAMDQQSGSKTSSAALRQLLQSRDIAYMVNSDKPYYRNLLVGELTKITGDVGMAANAYAELKKRKGSLISTQSDEAKAFVNAYSIKSTFDKEWENIQAGAGTAMRDHAKNNVGGSVQPSVVAQYLMTEHGVSPAAAAGILANIRAESSFQSGAEGDRHMATSSFGLFQHRGGRWNSLKSYGRPRSTLRSKRPGA